MRIISIGLGNIGDKYSNTLHNVGFSVLDKLSDILNIKFKETSNLNYSFFEYSGNNEIIAVKPKTFMNNSGLVIPHIKKKYFNNDYILLLICDNMDLPIGKIKIKKNNSSAGQNGLKSIFSQYNGDYYTLFVGIGRPVNRDEVVDYVLGKPFGQNRQNLDIAVENCANLILDFQRLGDIEKILNSMDKYNTVK